MALSKDAKVAATKGALRDLMHAMGSMTPERARKRKAAMMAAKSKNGGKGEPEGDEGC